MKRFKVLMDVAAIPKGMAPDMWVKLCDSNYIFYDSTLGNRPKLVETGLVTEDVEVEPVLIDTNGEQAELKDIQAIWADRDFWNKALYMCKQSPIHYYTEYACLQARHTQEGLNAFLDSLGLGATDDSADVMTEAAKQRRLDYAETITLEKLKDMKAIRAVEIEKYDANTLVIENKAKEVLELSDLDLLKKEVISTIMKTPVKTAPEQFKSYITKSAKWDGAMLRATDIDVLYRLWDLVY